MVQKAGIVNRIEFPILTRLKSDGSSFIPDSFYKLLEGFCHRNTIDVEIVEFSSKKVRREVCLSCLKAFIIDVAVTEYHMSIDILSLANRLNVVIGHSNYYLDNGEVRNIYQFF